MAEISQPQITYKVTPGQIRTLTGISAVFAEAGNRRIVIVDKNGEDRAYLFPRDYIPPTQTVSKPLTKIMEDFGYQLKLLGDKGIVEICRAGKFSFEKRTRTGDVPIAYLVGLEYGKN